MDPKALKRSRRLNLAYPKLYQSGPIDILIANDVYERLMLAGKIEEADELFYRESVFGWVVTGKYVNSSARTGEALAMHAQVLQPDANDQLRNFWKIEETPYLQRKKKSVKGTSLRLLHVKRMAGM